MEENNDKDCITAEDVALVDSAIFFDAAEAKRRTEITKQKIIESQMLPIYGTINKCINEGQVETRIQLTDSQRIFLKEKGYSVTLYTGSIYIIKWK